MCDFSDVFPMDLPGMELYRDIYFAINLESMTHQVSIPSYLMAPIELREIKVQLQDLLNKAFIRMSSSSWGDPMLFMNKKDGSMFMCITIIS